LVTLNDFNKSSYPIRDTKTVALRKEQEDKVMREELEAFREKFRDSYKAAS